VAQRKAELQLPPAPLAEVLAARSAEAVVAAAGGDGAAPPLPAPLAALAVALGRPSLGSPDSVAAGGGGSTGGGAGGGSGGGGSAAPVASGRQTVVAGRWQHARSMLVGRRGAPEGLVGEKPQGMATSPSGFFLVTVLRLESGQEACFLLLLLLLLLLFFLFFSLFSSAMIEPRLRAWVVV